MGTRHPLFDDSDDIVRLYYKLRLVRRVEEEIARIYPSDKIKSPVHLSIGQEAVAVGVCDGLAPGDIASPTYRGHATYLAHGGDLDAMMAELFGKQDGCAGGKAGSMHLIDVAAGVLGASAVVGTTVPITLGYALALKREGKGRIAVAFFGDGATEEGAFYECLNFAKLKELPVLFICENNGYAIHTPLEKRWAAPDLGERVRGFGYVPHIEREGDVLAIRAQTSELAGAIREGGGPRFLECMTYRWREHVGPEEDYDAGYRDRSVLADWQKRDGLAALGSKLPDKKRTAIDSEVETQIAAAIEFAEASPFPAPQAAWSHVYAD